jgi:hypothetical protein
MSRIKDKILAHKHIIIGAIAVAGLVVYVLPIGDILSPVSAAKGGQQSAEGGHPTNDNAYKVCEKKIEKGQQVPPPKKCYGFTGNP